MQLAHSRKGLLFTKVRFRVRKRATKDIRLCSRLNLRVGFAKLSEKVDVYRCLSSGKFVLVGVLESAVCFLFITFFYCKLSGK